MFLFQKALFGIIHDSFENRSVCVCRYVLETTAVSKRQENPFSREIFWSHTNWLGHCIPPMNFSRIQNQYQGKWENRIARFHGDALPHTCMHTPTLDDCLHTSSHKFRYARVFRQHGNHIVPGSRRAAAAE